VTKYLTTKISWLCVPVCRRQLCIWPDR